MPARLALGFRKGHLPLPDIVDHLAKYYEIVEISRELITSLMEMFLSMINNRMAELANRTNATVRRLHAHHDRVHAADAAGWDRGDVQPTTNRRAELEDCVLRFWMAAIRRRRRTGS